MGAIARVVVVFELAAMAAVVAPLWYLILTHWYYGVSLLDTVVRR